VIIVAAALALIPRDIRTIRSSDEPAPPTLEEATAALEAARLPDSIVVAGGNAGTAGPP
jgi:hypothetical protein